LESITSSNYQYSWFQNRRRHGFSNNPYPHPNDEDERQRLDKLHYVCRSFLGSNIIAPIGKRPTQIVDIGCGSGTWVIEVADKFRHANVYGTDLSPIQQLDVPQNVEYIVYDLTEGLDFDTGSTDLVHSRIIHDGVRIAQWPAYMDEVLRILKPGTGWAQCAEPGCPLVRCDDESVPKDAPIFEFVSRMTESRAEENTMLDGERLEQIMVDAGFVDVQARIVKLELGGWGKAKIQTSTVLVGHSLTFVATLGRR